MDKRSFLKTSGALAAGAVLSKLQACTPAAPRRKNWAGNIEYTTDRLDEPTSEAAVREFVRTQDKLRPLGTRHAFNTIADSNVRQLSTTALNKVVSLDKAANTVTVESGMKYGDLALYLDKNGYALQNMASLPHISVGGSCATATHGSGVHNGNLSTAVAAIEMVTASGERVNLSRDKDAGKFEGAVVGLGALGVVTTLTLNLVPSFRMRQVVYRNLPLEELARNFDAIVSSGYSVSLFTDWKNKNINEVWIKSRVEEGVPAPAIEPEFYGAKAADKNMHPVEDQSAENCTDQLGVPGPWFERLPHFKMGFTPSTGKELQAEYFVPIENAYDAIKAVETLHEKISPHVFISEIRTIAADDLWMSPCYKKACVAIHTTWKPEWDIVRGLLPQVEAQLNPFKPRPHWAKLFTMSPATLQARIARLDDFKKLMTEYDPKGKFRNTFIEENLFGK
jgi:xylitol oxidase